ncbi:VOC family protein [Desulfitobacterium metallireducens]|uniref:Lactoylglutathione lyase n=1 Tax=Desulfitobacterium metallireducens DSM 15288 TaxID=871968 RepID=W0E6G0_9FIRM|nr:VOC family protein [Desulfitobacterium metallireducens]AHF06332.1 lactoylglutathione lyase [Desulfitobacterium metallireducens DSM 15288]
MEGKNIFNGVEHIGIKTLNIEEGIRFYTEVLDFELLYRKKPGDSELAFLRLGGTVIELVEIKEGQRFEDGWVNHLAFTVSDINKAVAWLKQNQVTLLQEEPKSIGDGRYNFFFRGPSGEKLELFQELKIAFEHFPDV